LWQSLSPTGQDRVLASVIPSFDDGSAESGVLCGLIKERIAAGSEIKRDDLERFFRGYGKRMLKTDGFVKTIAWMETSLAAGETESAVWSLLAVGDSSDLRAQSLADFDSLPEGRMKSIVAKSLIGIEAQRDPEATLDWIIARPELMQMSDTMHNIGGACARLSDEKLREMLTKLPGGKDSESFIGSVASSQFHKLGGTEAIAWAQSLPVDHVEAAKKRIGMAWVRNSPAEGLAFVSEMEPSPLRESLFVEGALVMLQSGSDDRKDWLGKLSSAEKETVRNVITRMNRNDPEWLEQVNAEMTQ